jgi:hypothetical protein
MMDLWQHIRVRNDGHGETKEDRSENIIESRAYGLNGNLYPRVVITIWLEPQGYSMLPGAGFKVVCAIKRGPKHWWVNCGIPLQLVSEATRLLSLSQTRITAAANKEWRVHETRTADAERAGSKKRTNTGTSSG